MRATAIAVVVVLVMLASAASASGDPSLPDQTTCRFAKGLPSTVTATEIHLLRNSTECRTDTFTFGGVETLTDGRVCDFYVLVPWFRWYVGNRLDRDGTLRDGSTPYATFRDTSTPYDAC